MYEQTTKQEIKQIYEDVKRFNPKLESKLINKLSKLLRNIGNMSEQMAVSMQQLPVMSPCNVFMIIGKTEEAKRLLCKFAYIDPDRGYKAKIPELNFDSGGIVKSKYSMHLIFKLIEVLNISSNIKENESVIIQMIRDYPITLENTHFKIILAPKRDN